jgi:hypothetical protein
MTRQLIMIYCMSFFVLGSALKCNVCTYWTTQPNEQKCTKTTVNCPSHISYCFTSSVTYRNGTEVVGRDCASSSTCPNVEKACNYLTVKHDLKSCVGACCTTDNCNNYTPNSVTVMVTNYTPNSATVMVTKFSLSLMVIVGLIFA